MRLKGYDYSQAGAYFITICCQYRLHRFGNIEDCEMILNEFGQIAFDEWGKLPERFANMELDIFVVMPNHFHGIIVLNNLVGAGLAPTPNNDTMRNNVPTQNNDITGDIRAGVNPAPTENKNATGTIGDIVGAYKSLVANASLDIYKSKDETMGKLWQRNYYDISFAMKNLF